jgi:hypothetical protein
MAHVRLLQRIALTLDGVGKAHHSAQILYEKTLPPSHFLPDQQL